MLAVETKSSFGTSSDAYYSNPVYEKLVAREATELNFKRRQRLVYQAQKLFYDDVGYIVLFYTDPLEVHRTDTITGWKDVPGGIVDNWTDEGYLKLRPA
jgi:peptide/nickel transport system substrate-binding protein